MNDTDFGSAFPNKPSPSGSPDEPLRITPEDVVHIENTHTTGRELAGPLRIEITSAQVIALERYGVSLPAPRPGQNVFVGLVRNSSFRQTGEYSSWLTFSFDAEILDLGGNPIEYVPVLVSGYTGNVIPPPDGTPVAVFGSRNTRDGIVRPERVINLQNRAVIYEKPRDCFIATAVYGSNDAAQVVFLRRFRDQYLLISPWGHKAVQAYYGWSPSVARWVAGGIWRHQITRIILDTIVYLMRWLFVE